MPDPDLEMGGGGGGVGGSGWSFRPLDKMGDGLPKSFFRPFGPQFGPKIWEGRRVGVGGWSGPRVPPLDPPLPGIMFTVSGENPLHFPLSISTSEGIGYDSEVVK